MARKAGGEAELAWAREQVATAKTADELRHAQALLLPLELGLSLEQTARAIGRSVSLTCKLRNRRRRERDHEILPKKRKQDLRNHAATTLEREAQILDDVLAGAADGEVVVIPRLKPAYEKALGRSIALSTLYRALAVTVGENWHRIPHIRKVTPSDGRTSKKLPTLVAEALNTFATQRPWRLMFQDEARFGRISDCRYCWAKFPTRPTVTAMLTHEYVYAYSAVSVLDGDLDSLVLPSVNSHCMALFLAEVASRHPQENIVMVLDGAGWHKSLSMPIPDNLRLISLPPYSPELNPVEHLWDELREKHFHNRAFDSLDALEDQLVVGLRALEANRTRIKSICAWEWIIKAISIAN